MDFGFGFFSGGGGSVPFPAVDGLVSRYDLNESAFTTNENFRISNIPDLEGSNDLAQATEINQILVRKNGDTLSMHFDNYQSNALQAEVTGTPFSTLTDSTIVMCYYVESTDRHIMYGPGAGGSFAYAADNGSASAVHSNVGGLPNYYINGVEGGWTTRNNAFDGTPQGEFIVFTVKGADISAWANFNLGAFSGLTSTGGFYPDGGAQVVGLSIFDSSLSDTDREAVEAYYTTKYVGTTLETYTALTDVKVVEDTINGNNAANTGLDYDDHSNEIIIGEFAQANDARILILDASDYSVNNRIDVITHLTNIQGVAVDNRDPLNKIYYAVGVSGSGDLFAFDDTGALLNSYDIGFNGANIDFDSGYLFFYNKSNGMIERWEIDGASATKLDEIQHYARIPSGYTATEGLHVSYPNYYIINESNWTGKFDWSTGYLISAIDTGLSEIEGVTVLGDDSIAINDDSYFHGQTPNGNRLYIYSKD